ncbi:CoA-binding protein [Patescibacteria group bacterium]|nr:CoA-binding protein [Patescibacteria group bacterium]
MVNKLGRIFNPRTAAIIGATDRIGSVGAGLVKNMLLGEGERKVFLVNPNQNEIFGRKTFPIITDIPEVVDLAIVAVPASIVLKVVEDCCKKKVGGIIVISAGFSEIGSKGEKIQNELAEMTCRAGIALVGPNCLGIINTKNNLNASFAPATPPKGNVALISQSGAILDILADKAAEENYGISSMVSYGNEAGVTLTDFLKSFAEDVETKVIALYLEGLKDGRKFMEIAKRIVSKKPIIVIKAGKNYEGQRAIKSHTGTMAGDYQVYKSAFKQSGVIETDSLEELLDVSKILALESKCENSVAIITNGGGCGVLAADYCKSQGINLAELSKDTISRISGSAEMPSLWSKSNPIDIVGDASPARYKVAIEAVLSQKNIRGLIIIQTPQIMTDPLENAKIIVEAKRLFPKKPIVCFFLGGKMSSEAIKFLEDNNIPNYGELKRGIIALRALTRY